MQTECIDGERIAEVSDLPADHPLRRHVADCPRCRNLLRSYQKFVLAEPVAGFAGDAALRTLDALIASKVGERSAASRPAQSTSRFSLRGFLRPVPLLAAAAVCALVAVVVWRQSQGPDDILLRNESPSPAAALAPAEVRPDGSILLSWTAVPGADAYQVRIYGPGFTEVYRHPDVAETSAVIDRSSLPSDLPPQLDLLWRVYALQSGDVVQVSDPGSIRTR
jgi:hypothetical protein